MSDDTPEVPGVLEDDGTTAGSDGCVSNVGGCEIPEFDLLGTSGWLAGAEAGASSKRLLEAEGKLEEEGEPVSGSDGGGDNPGSGKAIVGACAGVGAGAGVFSSNIRPPRITSMLETDKKRKRSKMK